MNQDLINYLSSFLSEERFSLFKQIMSFRTRYITVVLEDIFQSQNASAVLRTCDCFGIQDVHIIENRNKFNENITVTRGSTKWINLYQYNQHSNNTLSTIQTLKEKGYKIVATSPHVSDIELSNFDLKQGKSAIIFGNEKKGVSDIVKQNADCFLKIPLHGFTESLNISATVAIILHYLTHKMKNELIDWKLTDNEQEILMIEWLTKSLKSGDLLLKKYQQTINI
jgi:tRNA (guanosine-2'-O-)-methyltransferase